MYIKMLKNILIYIIFNKAKWREVLKMAINYKCILAYGLSDEELDKIQKRRLKV